jgi:hypothetical protein
MTYYVVIEKDGPIWGCGNTPEEAAENSLNHIRYIEDPYVEFIGGAFVLPEFSVVECTKQLFEWVSVFGGRVPYQIENGRAVHKDNWKINKEGEITDA